MLGVIVLTTTEQKFNYGQHRNKYRKREIRYRSYSKPKFKSLNLENSGPVFEIEIKIENTR